MFENILVECCSGSEETCVCSPEERVLHAYTDGRYTQPMTPEQREWCLDEALHFYEGAYQESYLAACDDRSLANHVLSAWRDYCRSQGLI